jgi:hypothetical protein
MKKYKTAAQCWACFRPTAWPHWSGLAAKLFGRPMPTTQWVGAPSTVTVPPHRSDGVVAGGGPDGWAWGETDECAGHDERGGLSLRSSDADRVAVARLCGGGVSRWRRSDAPRWPASSPAAPGRKEDRAGHADSAIKYSEARLIGKGERLRWWLKIH